MIFKLATSIHYYVNNMLTFKANCAAWHLKHERHGRPSMATLSAAPQQSSETNVPRSKRKLQKHLRSAGLAYISRTGKLIPAKRVAGKCFQILCLHCQKIPVTVAHVKKKTCGHFKLRTSLLSLKKLPRNLVGFV